MHFPGIPTALSATFIVADELTVKAILGLDFLETHRCVINSEVEQLSFHLKVCHCLLVVHSRPKTLSLQRGCMNLR